MREIMIGRFIVAILLLLFVGGVSSGQTKFPVVEDTFLRSEASSSSRSLVRIPKDIDVPVLMISDTNGWFPIRYGTFVGWIEKRCVLRTERITKRGRGAQYLVVSSNSTALRVKPSKSSKSILTFPKGAKFDFDDDSRTNEWYRIVLLNGVKGWIPNADVTLETNPD